MKSVRLQRENATPMCAGATRACSASTFKCQPAAGLPPLLTSRGRSGHSVCSSSSETQCLVLPVTRPRVLLLLRLRVGLEAEVQNLSPRAEEPGCGFPTLAPGTLLPRIQSSWGPWSELLSSEAVCCLNQPADDLDLRASLGNRKERDSSAVLLCKQTKKDSRFAPVRESPRNGAA